MTKVSLLWRYASGSRSHAAEELRCLAAIYSEKGVLQFSIVRGDIGFMSYF